MRSMAESLILVTRTVNRFATALSGVDLDHPATERGRTGGTVVVPRITGPDPPVDVRDVEFLRANTDRMIKITLPDLPCWRNNQR
jgi:5-methyltetrahydropteroyltriglutamate--homocysteine methyltransferase